MKDQIGRSQIGDLDIKVPDRPAGSESITSMSIIADVVCSEADSADGGQRQELRYRHLRRGTSGRAGGLRIGSVRRTRQ